MALVQFLNSISFSQRSVRSPSVITSVIFTGVNTQAAGVRRTPLSVCVAHAVAQGRDWVCYMPEELQLTPAGGRCMLGGVHLAPWGALEPVLGRLGWGSAIRSCWGLCPLTPPAWSSEESPPVGGVRLGQSSPQAPHREAGSVLRARLQLRLGFGWSPGPACSQILRSEEPPSSSQSL